MKNIIVIVCSILLAIVCFTACTKANESIESEKVLDVINKTNSKLHTETYSEEDGNTNISIEYSKTTILTDEDITEYLTDDSKGWNEFMIKEDSKNNVQDITSFIPSGWNILEKCNGELAIVEGDLNKDGIFDKAFVIEEDIQSDIDPQRNLIIAFGNEDSSYTVSIRAENTIMLRSEGGGFGDPFDDIIIDRGSLLLKFFGGSSERWYMNYRFRYQNDGWYLIGATEGSFVEIDNAMDNIEEDYNLITGDYIIRKLEDGKIITIKGNKEKKQLVNLKDFVVD